MKLCIDYLREIQQAKGWSRYRMAKEVGLSDARMYQLFDKGGTYDDNTAVHVAKILGLDPAEVVAAAHLEREKNPEIRAVWEGILGKLSMGFETLISCVTPRRNSLPV